MQPDAEQFKYNYKEWLKMGRCFIIDLIYSIEDAVDAYTYLTKIRQGKVIISSA
jgi:hypothetical protein